MSQDVRLGDGPVNVRDDDGVRVVPQVDVASDAQERNQESGWSKVDLTINISIIFQHLSTFYSIVQ